MTASPDPGDIKLVATDLDGTLLRHDGVVSDFTRRVLRAVEDSGRHLVFVTGRPPRWMPMVVEATGHSGIAVCANGAVVYDLHTTQIVDIHALERELALEAAERLRAAMPGIAFAVERVREDATGRDVQFGREERYRARWPTPPGAPVAANLSELIDRHGAVKVLARIPLPDDPEPGSTVLPPRIGSEGGTEVDRMLEHARSLVGDLVTVTHSNPSDTLLEISALGVSKASTLSALAGSRGVVAGQVVAFGDQPNDLPMLAWAGHAYAVANAHPDVLAAVKTYAPSVDDDGVAQTLMRILGFPADSAVRGT